MMINVAAATGVAAAAAMARKGRPRTLWDSFAESVIRQNWTPPKSFFWRNRRKKRASAAFACDWQLSDYSVGHK